jgi:hypothetical protein
MLCGIDPGLKGGIAFVSELGILAAAFDVPTHKIGKRRLVQAREVGTLLRNNHATHTIIEDVWTRPTKSRNGRRAQGGVSTGNFMKATGTLYGVADFVTGVTWVAPIVWKRHFGLIGQSKEASRQLAIELWPDAAKTLFRFKKDVDKAEAALIARWYAETRGRHVQALKQLSGAPDHGLLVRP